MNREFAIGNTANYDEWLIEQLRDPEEALSYLEAAIEEYSVDNDFIALRYATLNCFRAQYSLLRPKSPIGVDLESLEHDRDFTPDPLVIDWTSNITSSNVLPESGGLGKNLEPAVHHREQSPSKDLVGVSVTYE